jgi:hypothetical protein
MEASPSLIDLADARARLRPHPRQGVHEVPHVLSVGAPRPRALLLLQPDFFFGDLGEPVEGRDMTAGRILHMKDSRRVVSPVMGARTPVAAARALSATRRRINLEKLQSGPSAPDAQRSAVLQRKCS